MILMKCCWPKKLISYSYWIRQSFEEYRCKSLPSLQGGSLEITLTVPLTKYTTGKRNGGVKFLLFLSIYYLEDEVLNLVIEYDVNGDGTIDFDEFLEMMKKQAEHQEYSRIKQLFLVQGCNLDATSDKAPPPFIPLAKMWGHLWVKKYI